MEVIYTFFSHFYAMSFHKKISALGLIGIIMPVPRKVSSSCGSCVKLTLSTDPLDLVDEGVEQVFAITSQGYGLLFDAEK